MVYQIPNILSFFRVLAAPFFFVLITTESSAAVQAGIILFIIGAVTDYVDGWFARRNKIASSFGIFLDPLADKVLTTAAFFAFVELEVIPLWMVIIVIIRDFGMTALRMYANSINYSITTSRSAKVKTFLQMSFIIYLMTFLLGQYVSFPVNLDTKAILYSDLTYAIMLALTIYTVWTIVEYLFVNKILVARLCRIPVKEVS